MFDIDKDIIIYQIFINFILFIDDLYFNNYTKFTKKMYFFPKNAFFAYKRSLF